MKQMGFFHEDDRLLRLSEMGDPLEKITITVEWEMFRPMLNKALRKESKGSGGRPPYDYVMMFKILLLQMWYGIADDNTEYLINDRLSFQRFLGLNLSDKVPDAKTIWLFRETLSASGVEKDMFVLFAKQMEAQGVITRRGSIVDASFIEAPKQRNNREENKDIKQSKIPEDWSDNKRRQKDTDARWTKKNDEKHFGYKNHVKVDKDSKMIINFSATDASVHDSQEIAELIDLMDKVLYADSAYTGGDLFRAILDKNPSLILQINEKGYRSRPLTEKQKESNRIKSKIRARVEHVFGHMTNSMGGMMIRCIGKRRANGAIALKNLAYNISRYVYLHTADKAPMTT